MVNPASFETGVAFLAMFRMGAIALPLSSMFGPTRCAFRLRHGGAKAVDHVRGERVRVREALGDGGEGVPLLVIGGEPEPGEHSYEDALAAASPRVHAGGHRARRTRRS